MTDWKNGRLWRHWADKYTEIFDDDDRRIAASQCRFGRHFHEWLTAITLFKQFGLFSLVEKYNCFCHLRKQEFLKHFGKTNLQLLPTILANKARRGPQCPDLLVFEPDRSWWFFCEVKGQGDKHRDSQIEWFNELQRATKVPIALITLSNNGTSRMPNNTLDATSIRGMDSAK